MNVNKKTVIAVIKINKILLGIAAGFIVFCGTVYGLNYMYVSDANLERVIFHQFYEELGQIDNLYLGSSHVYHGINAVWLSEISDECHFNLATSLQPLNGTFYLLKEADQYNDLSHVYVELYYDLCANRAATPDIDRIESLNYRNWQNTDYMRLSINKLTYMMSIGSIGGPETYVDICFPFSRYRTKLNDGEYVKQTVEGKRKDAYLNYDYSNETEEYLGNGYLTSSRMLLDSEKMQWQSHVFDETPMGETSEEYLRKTINYCQDKDIPITLFILPIYEVALISTENYDNYIKQVKEITEEYNVPFYDFNLAKEEYLPIQDNQYFQDVGHLNSAGADMFTRFFYEIVSRNEVENKEYFYDSYNEKLNKTTPALYGIYYRNFEERDVFGTLRQMQIIRVASNREEDMEYRIIMTPEAGQQYMVQDFDKNKEFKIPQEENGICTIVARMKGSPDEVVQTMEINY